MRPVLPFPFLSATIAEMHSLFHAFRAAPLLLAAVLLTAPLIPAHAQMTINELRQSANAHLSQGDFEGAIPDLEEYISLLKDSKRDDDKARLEVMRYQLALCRFFTGGFSEAEKLFREFIKLYPHGNRLEVAWLYLGDAQRFQQKNKEAIKTYEDALRKNRNTLDQKADLYVGTARAHLAEDDWEGAIPALREAYRHSPDGLRRSWAATLLATAYLKVIDLESFYPLVPALLSKNSFAERSIAFNMAALEAGDTLFAEERYREALWVHRLVYPHDVIIARSEEYVEVLRAETDFVRRRAADPRQLMRLQETMGELENQLEAVAEVENYDIELEFRIARGYMEHIRYREAYELFMDLADRDDKSLSEESLFLAFQCATHVLPWDLAYTTGEKYMEKFPAGEWFDGLTLMMGQMLAKEEKWEKTVDVLSRALDIRGKDDNGAYAHQLAADCTFLLGYASFMLESFEDAQRHYALILSAWPQHELRPAAEYWLGMSFLFDGKYAEASPHFLAVTEDFPDCPYAEDAMFRRGVCSYGESLFDESWAILDAFAQKYPKSKLLGEATMMRGDIAGALGQINEAVAYYRQAMEADDLNIEHYNHSAFQAGQMLTDAEEWENAKIHFLSYISRGREGSNIPLATYWVGKCILSLSGEEAALDYYRQSMLTIGKDRAAIGVDMILDEWIGLSRKIEPERAKVAWNGLQQSLRSANEKQDRTTALRLYRMLLLRQDISAEDREKVLARVLTPEVLPDASPAVLTFILDTAKTRGSHDLAKAAAERLISDFPETDYALDARMALADYAIQEMRALPRGSEGERVALSIAIRHLDVIRAVYATQPEAGQALMLLGALYTDRSDFQKADECYSDVLGVKEWRPMWAEALYGRGFCAMQDRQYMKACAYFERIYLMYSGYRTWAAKAYLRRAECLSRLGDKAKARETLQAMIDDPNCADLPELDEAKAQIEKL